MSREWKIDPENREQVERLARTSHDSIHKAGDFDRLSSVSRDALTGLMQAALREFANPTPPKPDEPTGLGAVVEDVEGDHFVRIDRGTKAWRRAGEEDVDIDHLWRWSDFAAVRVLSEGVTP